MKQKQEPEINLMFMANQFSKKGINAIQWITNSLFQQMMLRQLDINVQKKDDVIP